MGHEPGRGQAPPLPCYEATGEAVQGRGGACPRPGIARFLHAISPSLPQARRLLNNVQRGLASRRLAFFKIAFRLSHAVSDMGEADNLVLPGLGQRIEGRRLPFYRANAALSTPRDQCLRLAKGRVGRPAVPGVERSTRTIPAS